MKFALMILFLLTSCVKAENHWQLSQIRTSYPQKHSSCLHYYTKDKVNGIDLQMLVLKEKLTTYLHIHSQAIPAYKNEAKVKIITNDQELFSLAELHQGSQRVLMPDAMQSFLIDELQKGNSVVIQLEGYKEEIEAASFAKLFEQINRPRFKLPFKKPF